MQLTGICTVWKQLNDTDKANILYGKIKQLNRLGFTVTVVKTFTLAD